MQLRKSDKTLESFKIFPIVAWGLTFIFAVFVFTITRELQTVVQKLQVQTQTLQEKIDADPGTIEDFES